MDATAIATATPPALALATCSVARVSETVTTMLSHRLGEADPARKTASDPSLLFVFLIHRLIATLYQTYCTCFKPACTIHTACARCNTELYVYKGIAIRNIRDQTNCRGVDMCVIA